VGDPSGGEGGVGSETHGEGRGERRRWERWKVKKRKDETKGRGEKRRGRQEEGEGGRTKVDSEAVGPSSWAGATTPHYQSKACTVEYGLEDVQPCL